ncbi:MAG: polyketide synthase dehydratase domain-containing protein, partial [Deltaproteobacteria bacterium]|nr:polyketide synthase dehydratase domain-containing protein [Deltaproteobacteria bacterium]
FNQERVLRFYRKYSDFGERYRLLHGLDGSSRGVIRGRLILNRVEDFAGLKDARYQYSPYLLEALQHLVNSYLLLREEEVVAAMIPFGIGEMRFSRVCQPGEEIILEGRRLSHDGEGAIWDIRAIDDAGQIIMTVNGLIMKGFSA